MTQLSHQTLAILVTEGSAVGHARRAAVALAQKVGLDETRRSDLALIVTELGTNLIQHAGGGQLLVRALANGRGGVEILALDKGPGMASVARCLEDGYSTGGSRGAGLGSVLRLADNFDIYSQPGVGTAILAVCCVPGTGPPSNRSKTVPDPVSDLGVACVAYPGEDWPGDGWVVEDSPERTAVLVIDGLGHGPLATEAAVAAIRSFEQLYTRGAAEALEGIHGAIGSTRGAAGAVVTVDWGTRVVHFCGVGNISGAIVDGPSSRGLSSHNGILGQRHPRFQQFEYALPPEGSLVLHSDGLSGRWNLNAYSGLTMRDASLVAGVLYRDFSRRDDVTVVVLRRGATHSEVPP